MTESLQSCPNPWCGGVGPMPFALRDHKWAVICGCDFHGPTRDDREAAITAWNTRAPRSEGLAAPKGIDRSELVERELKRCHEVIGAYVIAQAYADTLPDDAEDAADMTFGQHYWEGAASHWAGEDLLSRAHEAAKARMRVENPVQVRDLDWSAAMGDVVASGGLPQDKDEDEDPVCTGCGGSGITYQTERPCACIPTALSAPSPSADALRPGEWEPIESAPKDGTRIIGLLKSGRAVTIVSAKHHAGWLEKPNGGWVPNGDYIDVWSEEEAGAMAPRDPTHWMPLPAPPKTPLNRGEDSRDEPNSYPAGGRE